MSPLGRRRSPGPIRVRLPFALADVLRDGAFELAPGADPDRASLDVAVVVPQFRRGSGGHHTIADLVRALEALGHRLSIWVVDEENRHDDEDVAALFPEFFGPVAAPVRLGAPLDAFDVVVATGWQTVPTVLQTTARARAYLVQDHEPEFYATSAERLWAEWTYRQGLHCICASPWLADVVRARYGASASSFDLGVDHQHYKPLPTHRRDDLVLAYARAVTPRRAVPLVVLALDELHRRRPEIEIALFGEARQLVTPFPHRELGVMERGALAHAYASAAVGLVVSLTNPSLVPTEMLACGLPVVDVASDAMVATFGAGGPIELAAPEPGALAGAIERLLDDLALRAERSRAGTALALGRTWERAGQQVELGLREALRAAAGAPDAGGPPGA
jgi:glycosyltransferase involved in cell wall biosynthesis